MLCKNCQKEILDDSKFCEFCGNNIITQKMIDQKSIKTSFKIKATEIKNCIEKNKNVIIISLLFLLVVIFLVIAIDLHTYTAPKSSRL